MADRPRIEPIATVGPEARGQGVGRPDRGQRRRRRALARVRTPY